MSFILCYSLPYNCLSRLLSSISQQTNPLTRVASLFDTDGHAQVSSWQQHLFGPIRYAYLAMEGAKLSWVPGGTQLHVGVDGAIWRCAMVQCDLGSAAEPHKTVVAWVEHRV